MNWNPIGRGVSRGAVLGLVLGCAGTGPRLAAQSAGATASATATAPAPPGLGARGLATVETVFTRFVQERHLSLFQEPLRTEGVLCFQKPSRVRWQITAPYESILVSDGQRVAQFERVNDRWKRLDLGLANAMRVVVDQIGAILEGRYAGSSRDYAMSVTNRPEGTRVLLEPQNESMRKMMRAIEIDLEPEGRGTRRIVLREVDGDVTDIRFEGQVAGAVLPPGTFDCSRPVDLDQIRRANAAAVPAGGGQPRKE